MFNNQNYNNEENNEEIYVNDSRLQRIGLYISDTFDQTSYSLFPTETVDIAEEGYNAYENVQSHLVRTRVVPVRTFRTPKPTAVLSNEFSSIQIISSNDEITHDLIQTNSSPDGTQRSVYLMNDKAKMLARRKCLLQSERKQKIESDEYHAVIVHEPEAKIPRPPNAFMIFANEWRKKVAHKFNNESNKDISVRLGQMWRSLDKSRKEEYFVMARKADAEHKLKYPDYVYNPKEARLRKALRDSWKDKGKHSLHDPVRCVNGKSNTENWSSAQSTLCRKLLPMPTLPNMTFSMAADGYSMMETPAWSTSWYPYRHNSVPYIVPQMSETYAEDPNANSNYSERAYHQNVNVQQSEVRPSVINPCRSPFDNTSEPEASKEPLSQLQELANVFSSPASCNRPCENDVKEFSPAKATEIKFANNTQIKTETESTVNQDSDSDYITDHPQQKDGGTTEHEFGRNVNKTGVTDVLMTENNGEPFMETFENNGQSNYINMDDVFLDCNFLSGEKNFGSNTSLDIADQGKNVLPGFQQAFGSTEIGRFSRNDFFTNPPPETPEKVSNDNQVEPQNDVGDFPTRKPRTKTVRKPRKIKNSKKTEELEVKRSQGSPDEYSEKKNGCVKKGRKTLNNDKSDIYRHHSVMSEQEMFPSPPFNYPTPLPSYGGQPVPGYRDEPLSPPFHPPRNQLCQGGDHPCGNQYLRPETIFPHSYEGNQHRYGYPDYPVNGYPYVRNNYPSYPNYEYPYFRPFGFHLDHGDSWSNSNPNWSGQNWMPPQHSPYNSWTSSNMFPFMRLLPCWDKQAAEIVSTFSTPCTPVYTPVVEFSDLTAVVNVLFRNFQFPTPFQGLNDNVSTISPTPGIQTVPKISKSEPHPWNPNPTPSTFPTDADYFSELCNIEESLLQSHPILTDPDFLNMEGKNNGKKQKAQVNTQKGSQGISEPSVADPLQDDELLDMLSTVIDDFNVDELLIAGSDKFNLC